MPSNYKVGQPVSIEEDGRRVLATVIEIIDADDDLCEVRTEAGAEYWVAPEPSFGDLMPAEPEYSI